MGTWYLSGTEVDSSAWQHVYTAEPCFNLTEASCSQVLGGEAMIWGEWADSTNLEHIMWPRLGAVAERLWSPRAVASVAAAERRLQSFRCHLLLVRGIGAGGVKGLHGPGSCLDQL